MVLSKMRMSFRVKMDLIFFLHVRRSHLVNVAESVMPAEQQAVLVAVMPCRDAPLKNVPAADVLGVEILVMDAPLEDAPLAGAPLVDAPLVDALATGAHLLEDAPLEDALATSGAHRPVVLAVDVLVPQVVPEH